MILYLRSGEDKNSDLKNSARKLRIYSMKKQKKEKCRENCMSLRKNNYFGLQNV